MTNIKCHFSLNPAFSLIFYLPASNWSAFIIYFYFYLFIFHTFTGMRQKKAFRFQIFLEWLVCERVRISKVKVIILEKVISCFPQRHADYANGVGDMFCLMMKAVA